MHTFMILEVLMELLLTRIRYGSFLFNFDFCVFTVSTFLLEKPERLIIIVCRWLFLPCFSMFGWKVGWILFHLLINFSVLLFRWRKGFLWICVSVMSFDLASKQLFIDNYFGKKFLIIFFYLFLWEMNFIDIWNFSLFEWSINYFLFLCCKLQLVQ